jgi:hypothetical protein
LYGWRIRLHLPTVVIRSVVFKCQFEMQGDTNEEQKKDLRRSKDTRGSSSLQSSSSGR